MKITDENIRDLQQREGFAAIRSTSLACLGSEVFPCAGVVRYDEHEHPCNLHAE